jgi:superfamily II DNA/RNA helicase
MTKEQLPIYEDDLDPDEALDVFLDWTSRQGLSLWPHQQEALLDLAAGDHVILGTPTGSGKTLVALGLLYFCLSSGKVAYYTAPIKALVNEKFFSLVELLGKDNVGMLTGDTHINANAPIVCCTEEIIANIALSEGEKSDVAAVVMDEFHYFADPERGWAWQVPLLTLPQTQFLLMSATLGDVSHIASSLKKQTGREVDCVLDAQRPVPLSYRYVDTPLEATVELAIKQGEAPLYLVHSSQESALHTAQALASYGVTSKEQRTAIKDACKGTRFTTAFGKILKHLLSCGVGVHHAGMLPRYRLLVEKLAQRGLLPVICGTDTLGVGINVPIHTVLFTALTKFDGSRMRRLRSREFHQIAGRAGRMGYDTEGLVIVEAPEYEIDNARALAKAGNDPKARRRIKRKRPPEGFVNWNEQTLERLAGSSPEKLLPHLRVTHAMVLAEILQGGDAEARIQKLIFDSGQTDEQKAKLLMRSDEIFATLVDAGVAIHKELPNGETNWSATVDLPEDFALDQPLSPFLLAAIELLDSESDTYALDVISMIEATLENPWSILRAQERRARDAAMAQMKADGIDYDERMERIADISYPKPLEGLLNAAFESYCEKVPWARDFQLRPKSVLRDMLETANDFKGYISGFGMARSEGTLLRYLSEAYHVLSRTIPADKFDERLKEILEWLGFTVRTVDSSLVDEWAASGEDASVVPPAATDVVVPDRRAVTLLVRNALWRRVRLIAAHDIQQLGKIDYDWGWDERRWRDALDAFFKAHDHVVLDADAHSTKFFEIDTSEETSKHLWHVRQTVDDSEGDRDFGIWADVLLDATQDLGAAVFDHYRAGFIEDLLGSD